ncbi:MAG: undecaprenyl-diphosphate phosphatase [Dehalococcoidia bacterium]
MDDYLRAALLGMVQALTEFLPVSSSGHLILAPRLLGDEASSLTFDVGLHVGTAVAVVGYFWRDWVRIIFEGVRDLSVHGRHVGRWTPRAQLGLWLALASVPAAGAGLLLDATVEEHLREPWIVGAMLIAFGLVIWVLDAWGGTLGRIEQMTAGRALIVGVAQVLALVPGVSRSGVTIAAARGLGFDRGSAARFSFLLSAPIVLGAGGLKLVDALSGDEPVEWGPLVAGAVVASVVGAFVIRALLAFLASHTLRPFVWYRIALGLAVLGASATGTL